MTSFALFGATLAGLVRRLRLGLLLHATRSDRGTPRHTVSKELCPPEPRQAKALPAANGDPPISNWYYPFHRLDRASFAWRTRTDSRSSNAKCLDALGLKSCVARYSRMLNANLCGQTRHGHPHKTWKSRLYSTPIDTR